MKIIHTSDWHLGQSFFNRSRQKEHQAFLAWLVETAVSNSVNAIIVAGDIFDTTTPPSYARQIYHQFISQLHQHNIQLVVLGGNHDSVAVLNESRELLKSLDTFVVPSTGIEEDEQVLVLHDDSGESGAIICAIPYIRPHDVLQTSAGQSAQSKNKDLENAIVDHYQHIFTLAQKKQASIVKNEGHLVPIVATGHLAALGVAQSESVRDIYIGTLNGFSSQAFPPADYIALGHIHKPQLVGKKNHIRYSGSPIALSFDETNTQKQINLLNFGKGNSGDKKVKLDITEIKVPVFQKLSVIKGDLQSIEQQISALCNEIQDLDESTDNEAMCWLSVHIEHQDYLLDLQAQIQDMIGEANIDVLQIKRIRNQDRQTLIQQSKETLEELKPADVFEKRLAMENFQNAEQVDAIRKRFTNILEYVSNTDFPSNNEEESSQ